MPSICHFRACEVLLVTTLIYESSTIPFLADFTLVTVELVVVRPSVRLSRVYCD